MCLLELVRVQDELVWIEELELVTVHVVVCDMDLPVEKVLVSWQ